MKKTFLAAILGLATIISCEKKSESADTAEHAVHHTDQNASDDHADEIHDEHGNTSAKLELDNGKKWKTNTEMLPFVLEQENLIKAYDSDNGDYKKLASDVSSANEKLIKSCTMTGRSHEVLHIWLTDHMDKINSLHKTEDPAEARKLTDELEHSMETYHQYFN